MGDKRSNVIYININNFHDRMSIYKTYFPKDNYENNKKALKREHCYFIDPDGTPGIAIALCAISTRNRTFCFIFGLVTSRVLSLAGRGFTPSLGLFKGYTSNISPSPSWAGLVMSGLKSQPHLLVNY